ncbi:hypothetical protein AB9P05_16825 [Roseivirga sp. BDSF3-8]|uniref:hypothetical protein n=1 Tax=Roseivirga sp. BDSF3-8 TaxID=3241598 RepID=UPI003531D9E6
MSTDLIILSIFSVIPLAFALVVLAPAYLNWQNKRILKDIVKLCDNRLEQEMISMWLADNYEVIPFDRQAYHDAARKIVAALLHSGYKKPHKRIKRTIEEFSWLTETDTSPMIEDIQTMLTRLDSVMNTLEELLQYKTLEEKGIFYALKEVFQYNLADPALNVSIKCDVPEKRYEADFEKQLAEGCMLMLIEMTYNRTGTNIVMDLEFWEDRVIIDVFDDDETYTNVDLLLQPPALWPFNFLFVRLIIKKYLGGKFTGPLNYHGGLHLQATVETPRLPVEA